MKRVEVDLPEVAARELPDPGLWLLEEGDGPSRLPVRSADSHKGTYGHLLVVAGSRGKSGAAALCARAALQSGAGRVTVATRGDVLDAVLAHVPELMGIPLAGSGALSLRDGVLLREAALGIDALVLGPGIPRGPETGSLLLALLREWEQPCVLDADALTAISDAKDGVRRLSEARGPLLLTPHPGEMARLLGLQGARAQEVQADRLGVARRFASEHRVTLVLKGARTLIAQPDGQVFVNPTGNPGMATAGSGDVLAGMLGAFLAQGLTPLDAAVAGVYAHGLAGDLAVQRRGQLGLTASDISSALSEVWVRWKR